MMKTYKYFLLILFLFFISQISWVQPTNNACTSTATIVKGDFIFGKPMAFDDSDQLSNLVSLEREQEGFNLKRLYPNPVSKILSVAFNSDQHGEVEIKVFDLTGRVMYATRYDALAGLNFHEIDVSNITPGIYMINLNNKSTKFTERIIKTKD